MFQVIINEETSHETHDFINKRLSAIKNQRSTGELEDLALIIGALQQSIAHVTSITHDFGRWKKLDVRAREGNLENVPRARDDV